MLKKLMLTILLIFIAIESSNQKACGLVELFNEVENLQKTNYVTIKEDLQLPVNGQQISVFGWIRFTDIQQEEYAIMKLQVLPNQNEFNWQQTLSNLFLLTYDATNPNNTQFNIIFAQSEQKSELIQQKFTLNQNQWVFLAYTVDYKKGNFKLYFNTYNNSQTNEQIINRQVMYPSFYLRQKIQFDIGCIPVDTQVNTYYKSCMIGQAKKFNFMLQYFDNPKYLLYMNYHKNGVSQYLFDFNQNQKNLNQLLPVSGQIIPMQIYGNKQFLNNSFVVRGDTELGIIHALQLQSNNEVQSPSLFMTFEFEEPLNKNFIIYELTPTRQTGLNIKIELIQLQNQQGRYVQFSIPQMNVQFITKQKFVQKKPQFLEVSFIQEMSQFWVIINNVSSPKYTIKGLQDYDLKLFEKDKEFKGYFKVVQLTLLQSASGFFYNYLQFDQKQECKLSCQVFSNLNYDQLQCLKCDQHTVLEPVTQQCKKYCVMGTKNIDGICVKCQTPNCDELQKQFFDIEKQEQDKFIIKILNNFNKNEFLSDDFFTVQVDGMKNLKDFKYSTNVLSSDPTGNTLILEIIFNQEHQNVNSEIIFTLKKDLDLYSTQKNQIPIQVVSFDRLGDSKPKKQFFETQQIPKVTQKENNQPLLQKQYQQTDFNNQQQLQENQNDSNNVDLFLNDNNQASSTSTNGFWPFQNMTTDQILHQYNTQYPLNDQIVHEKHFKEHEKKYKDENLNLGTNDVINKDVADFLFAITIVAICIGLIGQFFKYKFDDFLFQKYVQMILVFQYIAFLALYNTQLPETLQSFLGPLINNFLAFQRVFDSPLKEKHHQNSGFNLDYQTYTNQKFKEHEISQHIIINAGLLFLVHATVLVLLIIVAIIYKCSKKNNNSVEPNMFISAIKMVRKILANKTLVSMFLVFIIELTIFTLYNFEHDGFHHMVFQFSLFLAFLYFLVMVFCLMHITCHPVQRRLNERNEQITYPKGYGFVYQGLVKKGCGRYFQGLQYLHYFIYALSVMIAHHKPKVQIVFQLLILLVFSIYVFYKQPAVSEFWQFEQSFHQGILVLILFFFMIVVLDSDAQNISLLTKDIFGDFISYLMTVLLTWNAFIIIFCSFRNIYYKTCGKKNNSYDNINSNPQSVEMKKNKPQKEYLKNTIILEQSNEDDSQLIDNDEDSKKKRLNQTSL